MSQEVVAKGSGPDGALVAISGIKDAEALGICSWWRLAGPTQLDVLLPALTSGGVDEKDLPKAPSLVCALGRAVEEQDSDRLIVRGLEGRGNWALLDVGVNHVTMTAQQGLRVYCEDAALRFYPDTDVSSEKQNLINAIAEATRKHQGRLDYRDVSRWASDYVVERLGAVALRDTGGIYFVPRDSVGTWRRVTGAVEAACRHRWFEIPVARADKAIAGVLAALERDAVVAASAMEEELDAQLLGKRGLVGRRERCAAILGKVETYEGLLGVALDKLRGRLSTLQASFAAAALAEEVES